MKKLFFALFFAALTNFSFANSANPTSINVSELRAELIDLIGTPRLANSLEERVTIQFTVNAENEVVILSTDNEELDGYLKSRLNYKQLDTENLVVNERYVLPLLVIKK